MRGKADQAAMCASAHRLARIGTILVSVVHGEWANSEGSLPCQISFNPTFTPRRFVPR